MSSVEARALLRRILRAANTLPVPYVRRKTTENALIAFRLYADQRYDCDRATLLSGAERDAQVIEALSRLPKETLMLMFRKVHSNTVSHSDPNV